MRSSEIARIAGVSVRTLRHYHSLGLLDEPPRHQNGYRDYSALDLARVLRIRRLQSLGLSLADVRATIEEGAEGDGAQVSDDALARLDAELEAQIERLQEQRRTIALLRDEQLDPALPVRFSQAIKRLYGALGQSSKAALADHEAAMLVITGHAYGKDDLEELERVADKMDDPRLAEPLRQMEKRLDALEADASEEERQQLVSDALEAAAPIIDCLDPSNWEDGPDDAIWNAIDALQSTSLNAAQADVSQRIDLAIVEKMRRRAADSRHSA